jgi:hypothetical protein
MGVSVFAAIVGLLAADAPQPTPADAISVRFVRPREQGERFLALFRGLRFPHPAAALAAYRRAKKGDSGLGKAAEAGIAIVNTDMVAELETLDGAVIEWGWDPAGRAFWDASIPHDDGTFAAAATAMVLTGGASEPNFDRLGPQPDAAVAAVTPSGFVLASSAAALDRARAVCAATVETPKPIESGVIVHASPQNLLAKGVPLNTRRIGEAFAGAGINDVSATVALGGETLVASIVSRTTSPPRRQLPAIDPKWFATAPTERTLLAFALAIDPDPSAWDSAFAIADRVEKADPTRAGVAPLRLRLSLIAGAAGLRPDVDLLPILTGISGAVTVDAAGRPDGALVALHVKSAADAARLRDEVAPRVVRAMKGKATVADGRLLVEIGGQSLAIAARGDTLRLSWGPHAPAVVPKVGTIEIGEGMTVSRYVALWPGRLAQVGLPEAAPIVWVGGRGAAEYRDKITWSGLRATIAAILDRLPSDPPPDKATSLRNSLSGKG